MTNAIPCTICGGQPNEHEGRQHAYTTTTGELKTQAQAQKEQQQLQGQQQPMVLRLPGAQTNEAGAIGRLVEVLLGRGLIDTPEALYIAGMGNKPEQPPKEFFDPAPFFPQKTGQREVSKGGEH